MDDEKAINVTATINIFLAQDPAVSAKLDTILQLLTSNEQKMETFMAALDDSITVLQGDIVPLTTAVSGATALINGIAAQVATAVTAALAAGATPAQLQAMTDLGTTLTTNTTALAAAVAANTPGVPAGTPVPPVVPGARKR